MRVSLEENVLHARKEILTTKASLMANTLLHITSLISCLMQIHVDFL